MEVAKIRVTGANATVTAKKAITSGMVGAKIHIDYSSEWNGLMKTIVFSGVQTKDVVTNDLDVVIPADCITKPIQLFKVGVYGVNSESNLVIPTLWANIGPVLDSADPSGDTSTDQTIPVWAQLRTMIGDLDNLTTDAKNSLVAAINEVADSFSDVSMDVSDGYIRYSIDGGMTWERLIAVSDLVGPKGEPGIDGTDATVTAESIRSALGYTPVSNQDLCKLETKITDSMKSGSIADAELHLGFYIDDDGDLCQKEE